MLQVSKLPSVIKVSFWIDEEQSHQESRIVLNEAISHITEGRVSPIASSLCSNWDSTSSSQKCYYLRKVCQVFSAVLSTIAPDQEDEVFEALLRSSGYDIRDFMNQNATQFENTETEKGPGRERRHECGKNKVTDAKATTETVQLCKSS